MDSEASQIERQARHHLMGLKAKDLAAQWYEQEKVGAHPEGR